MVRYSKEDVLNPHERKILINNCENDRERLVIKGLLYTGMRASEFANLKEWWFDWQEDLIRVPSQDGDWKPKTKKGARRIPLIYEAKVLFRQYFEENKKIKINRVTVFRIVKRVASRIRPFKKCYPHSLRATFATMLAEKGMPASDIQNIMGWEKLETANNYVNSTKSIDNFRDKVKDIL